MKHNWTFSDFERAKERFDYGSNGRDDVVLAALEIAVRVTFPGLIEEHCVGGDYTGSIAKEAAAIRSALLG